MTLPLPTHHVIAVPAPQSQVRWCVGVDGGGTGTRVKLADCAGRVLGEGESGPSALGQGVAQAWRHIQEAVVRAVEVAGLTEFRMIDCALAAGLSGANVLADAQAFLAAQPGYAAVLLENDGYTQVLGAHGGRPGMVVAAGTGTIGEVIRADGSRAVASGWGWTCGDEGSGAWLGLRAMQHAQQAEDGRATAGALAHAIWAVAGSDRDNILAWCANAGQQKYASLAPLVFEAAEAGDPLAQSLLQQAAQALEDVAVCLDPDRTLPTALAGSIAQRLAPLFSGMMRARCVDPQGGSADGALLLVRQALSLQTSTS